MEKVESGFDDAGGNGCPVDRGGRIEDTEHGDKVTAGIVTRRGNHAGIGGENDDVSNGSSNAEIGSGVSSDDINFLASRSALLKIPSHVAFGCIIRLGFAIGACGCAIGGHTGGDGLSEHDVKNAAHAGVASDNGSSGLGEIGHKKRR